MLIDWFTVSAQVVNFLILVWLLKRFLYRPILDAIDAREQRIATKIADAEAKDREAQKQQQAYRLKNEAFEQQRNTQINQMQAAVNTERERLLDAARKDSEVLRKRLVQAQRNEQLTLNEELRCRTQKEVFAIARKALCDLAGTALEQRMTEIFIARLRELDAGEITRLKSTFNDSLRIQTAFKLSAQQQTDIEEQLAEVFGKQKSVEFVIAADLISGIEISANGRKIAWSITDYLGALERSVDELLKPRSEVASANPENSGLARTKTKEGDSDEH